MMSVSPRAPSKCGTLAGNRLSADHIDIDRPAQILKAKGQVVSQILDTQAPKSAG